MARISISIPDNIHQQVVKMAGKENDSISYTISRLVDIGLMVMNSKDKNKDEKKPEEIEEYCQKLIIQINGIVKDIAINQFNFDGDKIAQISNDTLSKFNQLKGV